VSDNLVPLLQLFCEIDPPAVSRQWIERHDRKAQIELLISKGALIPTTNAEELVCDACDEQHWICPDQINAKVCRGFCPTSGTFEFSSRLLQRFAMSDAWVTATIASTLSIKPRVLERDTAAFHIGRAKIGPYACEIFFGRRLFDRNRFDAGISVIRRKAGNSPVILLTTTRSESLPGAYPSRCAIIAVEDVLIISRRAARLNEAPILAALQGWDRFTESGGIGFRFSFGFRSCVFGSKQYDFTDKQARVIEALYRAREQGFRGLHQDEIRAAAETNQRVAQLFAGHRAYRSLIKHDGAGRYWLDI
jgi:hypothetical protein